MQPLGASRHVMLVLGTRPEAIKMLPVLAELRRRPGFAPYLLSTGQHRAMLAQVMENFGEVGDLDLGLMAPGQGLSELFARILLGVGAVLERERPGLVLVHGDTTTALAAALAAFHARIPIGHVEAGQRSFDLDAPFPEELNLVAVDAMEALASGVVKLVGTDRRAIRGEVARLLDDPAAYAAMARHAFPFGDGTAARRIADAIEDWAADATGSAAAA